MKKILIILFTFIALSVSAQNTHKQSNANTVEQFQGAVETKVGLINAHFSDTTEANLSWIKTKPFAQIVTGDGVTWLRNGTATKWIGTGSASINISSDSTSLIICNGSGTCDTIPVVTVAPITNFTILNDTTIEVCGINSCDTIYTLPINYNQNVVNSVSVVNGVSVDSVFYFINGVKYLAGTIPDYSNKADSTTTKKLNDSTYVGLYWVKGIPYQKGDTIKIHSTTIDSINVSILNGGKIDTSHLPVSKLYIQQAGSGETHIVRASNDTTLSVATLKNTDDITISKASDSAVLLQFTHPHYTKSQVDSIAAGISGGGSSVKVVIQTYTGSSSVTVTDSTTWLIINPASLAAAMTITLPESPTNGQDVVISFGGTITSGTVVTELTINPNTGQTILQATTPGEVEAGEAIKYRYNSDNSKWYRL